MLGPEHAKESLFHQLKALPEKVNLAAPLLHLVDKIRKGGNIAAHFDMEKEPDQQVAGAMVDLLDYLFEYVFALPERAAALETRLENLGKDT